MKTHLPMHVVLTDRLRDEITSGVFALGTKLPPEVELAGSHGVSRATLRRALSELEREGLIERRRRIGTVIASHRPRVTFRMAMSNFPEVLSLTRHSRLTILGCRRVANGGSPLLGDHLSPTGHWLEITAVRHLQAEGLPVSWLKMFVSGRFSGIEGVLHQVDGSVFELVERTFALKITRLSQSVTAIACYGDAARSIGLAPGAPAIRIDAELFTGDELVEITHAIYDPVRFRLSTDVWVD